MAAFKVVLKLGFSLVWDDIFAHGNPSTVDEKKGRFRKILLFFSFLSSFLCVKGKKERWKGGFHIFLFFNKKKNELKWWESSFSS